MERGKVLVQTKLPTLIQKKGQASQTMTILSQNQKLKQRHQSVTKEARHPRRYPSRQAKG